MNEFVEGDELTDYHIVQGILYAQAVALVEVDEEPGVERTHVLSFVCTEGRTHNFVFSQEAWETLVRETADTEPV